MAQLTTPAFWDLHLHGVAGIDFMHADDDELVYACEKLGRHGTGAFAPTLLTSEPNLLRDACRRWGNFLSKVASPRYLPALAARPLGLHLEGPFLNPKMAGAHPPGALARPSVAAAEELIRAARGQVAIVTLAPELPGALALIRKLRSKRIRVQMGHTTATTAEALAGAKAGATGLTHLYNAMRIHHRDSGVLAALLAGTVTAELITDGLHLDPAFVRFCWRATGAHLYAVSDGCSAVGARAGTRLTLGSLKLKRQGAAAVVAASGTLAGGATYLCEHPGRVCGPLAGKERNDFLRMYYAIQQHLFPGAASAIKRRRNHFDARSLRFIASE